MRPLLEIAQAVFEHCEHADQEAELVGDVTASELLALSTYAFGALEKAGATLSPTPCAEVEPDTGGVCFGGHPAGGMHRTHNGRVWR